MIEAHTPLHLAGRNVNVSAASGIGRIATGPRLQHAIHAGIVTGHVDRLTSGVARLLTTGGAGTGTVRRNYFGTALGAKASDNPR